MIVAGSKRVRMGSVSHKLYTRTKMYMFRPICQSGQFANCAAKSANLQIDLQNLPICKLARLADWTEYVHCISLNIQGVLVKRGHTDES